MVNFNQEHRKEIKGEAANPSAFSKTPFSVSLDEKDEDFIYLDWDGPGTADHEGIKIHIPEYVFLAMAEEYLNARWGFFMKYKGIQNLWEITAGDASFYFKKMKLSKNKTIQRLKDYHHGVL